MFKVGDIITGLGNAHDGRHYHEHNRYPYSTTDDSGTYRIVRLQDKGWIDVMIVKHPLYKQRQRITPFVVESRFFKVITPRKSHLPTWL